MSVNTLLILFIKAKGLGLVIIILLSSAKRSILDLLFVMLGKLLM